MASDMTGARSPQTDRIITLLGQGIMAEQVAAACGLSASMISQIASHPENAKAIAELRFKNLSQHNERDDAYGKMEDELLESLRNSLCFLGTDPVKIARVLLMINKADRRGQAAPTHLQQSSPVVQLTLPIQIINQFTGSQNFVKDVNNQVIRTGDQELVTVQSANMNKLLEAQNVKSLSAPTESFGVSSSGSHQEVAR